MSEAVSIVWPSDRIDPILAVTDQTTLFDDTSAPTVRQVVETRADVVEGVDMHPAVARWFETRFPEGATPPQRDGWPHIAAREHTLIAAPTGSGKTLAGFLMSINRLYLEHAAGLDLSGAQVVYVSPLKALAVDIGENLERPLAEIADIAAGMGLDAPDLRVGVRTGDTPAGDRAAMVRQPPAFIITTPESLYLMVTAERSRAALSTIDTVIVDEIHALARDKRGAHLTVTLERLDHVVAGPLVRVGLSATQKPIELVAQMLVGTRRRPDGTVDCRIVDGGHVRAIDLALVLPDGELEAVISHSQMDNVLAKIAAEVLEHRTTIVFVNARRMAERIAHQLGEMLGDDVVSAHHGSLSRERRHRVETRLRAGELKALVATASLELGIDIGPVELVCQIGSPRSIATFLQRVGRSNHTRSGTPKGRLYPLTRDELVECAALLRGVRAGHLDAVEPPVAPLDLLSQQIVAETAAAEWSTDELYELFTRAYHYRDLSRAQFDDVLELASDGIMTGRGRRAAYVHHDSINGEVRGRKGARLTALMNGGAIPELGDYRVVLEPDSAFIGTVNEDWAAESMAGDIFLLGTHSWQISRVTSGEVRVVDAGDRSPTVPFWLGEAPARTAELSSEVSALRSLVDGYLLAGDPVGACAAVRDETGLGADAAAMLVAYLEAGRTSLGIMPTGTDLVMERFFDESGGMQLVIHSPLGGRLNRAMGYALRKKFCRTFNFELQASASDDSVVISLGPHHSFPLTDVPRFLHSGQITETLTQAVLDQPVFLSRWRWNLNRSLVVPRMRGGKKNPPPLQRMQADDMMAALFPGAAACQENVTGPIEVPDHVLVTQTIHDTLTEALDADGLDELWSAIEAGDVRMHARDTIEPSVFAHEILTARPYAFLDDGEFIDRRTNAVPLTRGLPTEPEEFARLDPAAIDRVADEISARPETPDELHDLLSALVYTVPRPVWAAPFAALEARGRVVRHGGASERWATTESGPTVDALLDPADPGHGDAVAQVLRGHLDLHSPIEVEALAEICGLDTTTIRVGLAGLESEGFAISGHFRGDENDPPEWSSRRLLMRMHHYSRNRRRDSVRSASPETFMRFLLRWQHVAPGNRVSGPAGLSEVVAQLQGYEAAVSAWEPEILAARVSDYRPEWLDTLCHNGELTWARLRPPTLDDPDRRSGSPSRSTPVALVVREDAEWLAAAVRGLGSPAEPGAGVLSEILGVLDAEGACFPAQLGAELGRMPTEIEDGLWEGVSRGLLTSDGFTAVRALSAGRRTAPRTRGLSRRRSGVVGGGIAAGRWSRAVPAVMPDEPDEMVEALADQLLHRWGVIFYDLVAHEHPATPWRDLQRALRRLEDRGLIRGGRFVEGFSGEQFALPHAADALAKLAGTPPDGRSVELCGSDPLNLTGVVLRGERIPARVTERVELPL